MIFVLASWRDPGYARLHLAGADTGGRPCIVTPLRSSSNRAPFSLIELSVNGRRAASAYVPGNAREVRFENTPLDGGRNVVVARTTLWYAASRRAHTADSSLDNPPAPGGRSAIGGGRSRERLSRSATQRPFARAGCSAARSRRGVRGAAAAQRSRDRRAAGRWLDLPAFVDDVFGEPRFNRKPISGLFAGAHPRFYVGVQTVTVSADSGRQPLGLDDLPAFAGDVEIANASTGPTIRVAHGAPTGRPADTRVWRNDVLRVHVDDYRVAVREPAPQRTEGATYVWERPFTDAHTHVTMSLTFAPFSSPAALRRGLNLPVFAFAPHVAARFLAFLHGFVLAVPMFAYLVLSRGREHALRDSSLAV